MSNCAIRVLGHVILILGLLVPAAVYSGAVHANREGVSRALQMNVGELRNITKDELWKALVLLAEQPELFEGGLSSRVTDVDSQGALIRTARYEGKTYRERVTFDPKSMSVVFANMDTGQSASRSVMADDPKNLYVSFNYEPSATTSSDLSWNKLQETHNSAIVDFFNSVPRLQREGYLVKARETQSISRGTYQINPSTFRFSTRLKGIAPGFVEGTVKSMAGTFVFPDDLSKAALSLTFDMLTLATGDIRKDAKLLSPSYLDARHAPKLVFASRRAIALSESFNFFGSIKVKDKNHPITLSLEYRGRVPAAEGERLVFSGKAFVRDQVINMGFEAVRDIRKFTAHEQSKEKAL